MTKTPYERAKTFLEEVDPRHQQKLTASIAPWIINRVAELLPPEPTRDIWAEAVKKATPEWGEPIPTPGASCPEWLTLDDLRDGYCFTNPDGYEKARDRMRPHAAKFESWLWDNIVSIKLRPNAPAYAKIAENERGEAVAILEAAGYTVTPPAPPEPDYEAYREKLTAFYNAKHLGAAARAVDRGDELSNNAKANIRALIAVGVKP